MLLDLNTDIMYYICDYLNCLDKLQLLFLSNKNNNQSKLLYIISCRPRNYKNLYGCGIHKYNMDISYVVDILCDASKQQYGTVNTIHFDNLNQMRLASLYTNDFGEVIHTCCNGKGVMYHISSNHYPWYDMYYSTAV